MTLPLLPPAKDTDDVVDDTYVDRVRAYIDYWGGNRPAMTAECTENFRDTPTSTTEILIDLYDVGNVVDTEYGSETWDLISGYYAGGWIIPVDGRYDLSIVLSYAAGSTSGYRRVGYHRNGSGLWLGAADGEARLGVSGALQSVVFDEGDEVNFVCWQNSGGDLEVLSASWSVTLSGEQ